MNHLHLHLHLAAVAAQHAAKWQMSGSEVTDVRIGGLVALGVCVFGMTRTILKGRDARAMSMSAAERAAATEHAQRLGNEWLAARAQDGAE